MVIDKFPYYDEHFSFIRRNLLRNVNISECANVEKDKIFFSSIKKIMKASS